MGDTHEADYQKTKAGVMDEVKHLFKPEFLNRIDETIVFHPLTKENVKDIADIMLKTISKRIKELMSLSSSHIHLCVCLSLVHNSGKTACHPIIHENRPHDQSLYYFLTNLI